MTAEFPLAVHALVYLLHKGTTISSQELAVNTCTNPARVRKVMSKLHRAGLVDAGRGKGSGYQAKENCAELSLSRVLSALEEDPIDMNWRSGDMDQDCLISSGMAGIMDGIYDKLNGVCRETLSGISIGTINDTIFVSVRNEG